MGFGRKTTGAFRPGILCSSIDLLLPTTILILLLALQKSKFCTAEAGHYLHIPAFGREAQLGHLYNEVTGEIRGGSIFSSIALPPSAVVTANISRTNTKTGIVTTKAEKFKFLGIDRNTAADILAGNLPVQGSASFLDEERRTEDEVTGIVLTKFRSATQRLLIFCKDLGSIYNTAILGHKEATHVITEITWGNTAIVTLIDHEQLQSKQNSRNSLQSELKLLTSKLPHSEEDAKTNFCVTLTSDLDLSIDLEPTRRQIQDIKNQIKAVAIDNEAQGVPLEFTLTPIQVFRDYLEIQNVKSRVVEKLDSLTLDDAISVFDDISIAQLRLRNLKAQLISQEKCLAPASKVLLEDILKKYDKFTNKFTTNFQSALASDRSMSSTTSRSMADLLEEYREAEFNSQNINSQVQQFDTALKKIQFCKLLENYSHIDYIEMGQTLVSKALGSVNKQIFVLFIKREFETNDNEAYKENVSTFFDLLYKPFNKLFIMDCDFDFAECKSINDTLIKQYQNGKFTIEDVNKEIQDFKMSESLEMKAIGRVAQLGELYDARTERFLGRSIFAGNIPEALKIKTEINTSVTNIISSETYEDRFAALNVDPPLQLSILAEMFPLRRSGQYLADLEFGLGHSVKSVVHLKRSEDVEIDLLDSKISDFIHGTALTKVSATHIVVKVEFGVNSIFSLSIEETNSTHGHPATNPNGTSTFDNSVNPTAYLNLLKNYIQEITKNITDHTICPVLHDGTLSVNVYSDIQDEGSKPVRITNNEELQNYFTNELIPEINNLNTFKGRKISYVLYPIENLKKSLGLFSPRVLHQTLDAKTVDIPELSRLLNQIHVTDFQIQKMSTTLNENPECTSENELKTLKEIQEVYKVTLGSFRPAFKEIVGNIKKGEVEQSALEKFRKEFESNIYFGDDFRYKELLKLSQFENRFRFYRQLKEDHILYLGRENDDVSFNKLFTTIRNVFARFYVLYFKQSWVADHGDIWRTSSQTFYSKLKESNNSIVRNGFVVDCEFSHPYCDSMSQPTIHEYKNGQIASKDFVLKVEKEESSVIKSFEEIKGALNATENQYSSMKDEINTLKSSITSAIDESQRQVVTNVEGKMASMKNDIIFIKENFESKTNCSRNKCFNGGNCTNSNTGFLCACPSGFQGKQCEKQINFCESSPCQNNGYCQNGENGYKCLCSKGFSGANCAMNVNECSSGQSPCQNGGHCIDEEDGFTCACRLPWIGHHCQAHLNACNENICQNGGACTNSPDYWDFDCNCKPGYSGKTCELDVDECSLNSTLCHNQGTCQNTNGSYTCVCAAGFTGKNCDIVDDLGGCGGTVTSDSGSINYKSDQIINQEEGCLWTIAAKRHDASHIVLLLTAAGFLTNDRHFLSVGYFNNSDYSDGAFIWKKFGPFTPETIEVPTPVAFIHFVVSGTHEAGTANKGFVLNFRSENRGSFNANKKYTNIFLTGPSGSRRYPLAGNYVDYERAAMVVQPTAKNSSLNVMWWNLEIRSNGNVCCDYVSIWILQSNLTYSKVDRLEGLRSASSLRRYNSNLTSRIDPFLIVFHSDPSFVNTGFEFSWGS